MIRVSGDSLLPFKLPGSLLLSTTFIRRAKYNRRSDYDPAAASLFFYFTDDLSRQNRALLPSTSLARAIFIFFRTTIIRVMRFIRYVPNKVQPSPLIILVAAGRVSLRLSDDSSQWTFDPSFERSSNIPAFFPNGNNQNDSVVHHSCDECGTIVSSRYR